MILLMKMACIFRGFLKLWYFDYSAMKDFDMTIIHVIEIAYIIREVFIDL